MVIVRSCLIRKKFFCGPRPSKQFSDCETVAAGGLGFQFWGWQTDWTSRILRSGGDGEGLGSLLTVLASFSFFLRIFIEINAAGVQVGVDKEL